MATRGSKKRRTARKTAQELAAAAAAGHKPSRQEAWFQAERPGVPIDHPVDPSVFRGSARTPIESPESADAETAYRIAMALSGVWGRGKRVDEDDFQPMKASDGRWMVIEAGKSEDPVWRAGDPRTEDILAAIDVAQRFVGAGKENVVVERQRGDWIVAETRTYGLGMPVWRKGDDADAVFGLYVEAAEVARLYEDAGLSGVFVSSSFPAGWVVREPGLENRELWKSGQPVPEDDLGQCRAANRFIESLDISLPGRRVRRHRIVWDGDQRCVARGTSAFMTGPIIWRFGEDPDSGCSLGLG